MAQSKFNTMLSTIPHFSSFPAMRPYIGDNYGTRNKKILIIAESNYLPEYSTIQQNAKKWYSSNQGMLNEGEINYINCIQLCETKWQLKKGHVVYHRINKVLAKSILHATDEKAFSHIAFMNAFQRPSPKTGDSIKNFLEDIDIEVATNTINETISIIEADIVIFTSKLAWERLHKRITRKEIVQYTCHPASIWWFRKDYKHNRDKFYRIIEEALCKE